MRTAFLLIIAVCCAACSGSMTKRLAADLAWEPETVVETGFGEIWSPFDEVSTGFWRHRIESSLAFVSALYEEHELELTVRLVPFDLPPGSNSSTAIMDAFRSPGAVPGYALSEVDGQTHDIIIGVPDSDETVVSAVAAFDKQGLLRHEFSHALCRRAGLSRLPRWLDDGLAETVRYLQLRRDDGRPFWDDLPPEPVLALRGQLEPGAVRRLLAWRPIGANETSADEFVNYHISHALVLFLMLRDGEGSFLERAKRLADMPTDALLAAEPEWLAWLDGLDPVLEVQRAAASGDWMRHDRALERMGSWARAPEWSVFRQRPYVEFAALSVDRRETAYWASTYLLEQAKVVRDEVVAELAASATPFRFLTGQALRVRRGGDADQERVQAVWDRLSHRDKARMSRVARALGLEFRIGLPAAHSARAG